MDEDWRPPVELVIHWSPTNVPAGPGPSRHGAECALLYGNPDKFPVPMAHIEVKAVWLSLCVPHP